MAWTSLLMTLIPLLLPSICHASKAKRDPSYPERIHLNAAILTNAIPLAYVDESQDDTSAPFSSKYQGFQPDLLRAIIGVALDMHNISLTLDLEEAPAFSYDASFDKLADDCNTTRNQQPLQVCHEYDLLVGDYYALPQRSLRAHLTPALLTTSATAVKYVYRQKRDIATFAEAQAIQEPICLLDNSYFDKQTLKRYPGVMFLRCYDHAQCLQWMKDELCVLFVEDELQLKYLTVHLKPHNKPRT